MEWVKVKAKRGLQSFLTEIARYSKTSGFHYHVKVENETITIRHHHNKWLAVVKPYQIVIITENQKLVLKKNSMWLENEGKEVNEINEICDTVSCYTATDIVQRIIFAVLLQLCYNDELRWLYRWVSG